MHVFTKIFKGIFVSEDILRENEEYANYVVALTMTNIFGIFLITWILTYYNVFKIGMDIANTLMIRCIILLVIPVLICYVTKGKGKWIKHILFTCFILLLAIADAMLKYNVTLIMVLPVVLAARYYDRNFTIGLSVVIMILFAISTYMSAKIGAQDINSYNLIIPEGTTITINSTLRDAVSEINVDETQRIKNMFLHFYLPKVFVFNIVAFACAQISQSGKKMIEKQEEITKKGARIETELNLANAIQQSMLPNIFPPFPEHKEVDLYASMIPAKEIGGDFYDMFLIDDKHLAICIADVSGKGIPASLVMMITKILIKNVTIIDSEVDKSLTHVNKMLCDGNRLELFVTCWFGVLDLSSGKLSFVNAGHNPPLLYSAKEEKFEYLKTRPNMVLAGLEKTKYDKNEILIEPGDRLFLYTDGVTESTNMNKELYGEERLKKFLNDKIYLNAEDTIDELTRDLKSFVGKGEQFDDITMLELIYKKQKNENISIVKKEFKARINNLHKVQRFVESELEKNNCEKRIVTKISLAIEEVFVNISKYAYVNKDGNCTITIEYDKSSRIKIIIEDSGIPFDPLEHKEPDITLPVNKRNIGGLGIMITKKTMDDVSYKYKNNKNILTLTKNI